MDDRPKFLGYLQEQLAEAGPPIERRRRRSNRLMAGAASIVLVVAAVAIAPKPVGEDEPTEVVTVNEDEDATESTLPAVTTTEPVPTTPPEEQLGVFDDRKLDTGFLAPRGGHTVVWTGAEMIVWGGWNNEIGDTAFADGGAYDPVTNAWRQIAQGPLAGRGEHEAVWTGREMLIVGGQSDPGSAVGDGAAYDPLTDTWRLLPELEVSTDGLADEVDSVWTGAELVLWNLQTDQVQALDPRANTWSLLASPGLEDAAVQGALQWTGVELVALAGYELLAAATLRPGEDTEWQTLPQVDYGDPFPTNSAVVNGTVIVWARNGRMAPTFMLDKPTRTWVQTDPVPVAPCEGHDEPLAIGADVLVIDLCFAEPPGGAAVFEAESMTWKVLDRAPDGYANLGEAVWTGEEVLVVESTCCYGSGGKPFEWAGTRIKLGY